MTYCSRYRSYNNSYSSYSVSYCTVAAHHAKLVWKWVYSKGLDPHHSKQKSVFIGDYNPVSFYFKGTVPKLKIEREQENFLLRFQARIICSLAKRRFVLSSRDRTHRRKEY
jgi:hypothetical protein